RRDGSGRSRFRNVFIFLRSIAADAYCADDFAFIDDRYSALKRCRAGQREGRNAPVAYLIFEDFAWPSEDRGGAGLADADLNARNLRIVEAVQDEQISAVIDDRNHYRGTSPVGFSFGGRCDLLRNVQCKNLLGWQLRVRSGDGCCDNYRCG